MYSVEFLLRFQNDQTEPPEKIKLFSEIYMPSGGQDAGTQNSRGQARTSMGGGGRGKGKGPQTAKDGRDIFGTQKTYAKHQHHSLASLDLLEHRVEDPYKIKRPEDEQAVIIKKVKGILNKLTPEKFEPLSQQMQELNFDVNNQDLLNEIIRCVFGAAVKQSQWCNIYADLCKDLTQKFAPQPKKDGEDAPAQRTVHASFRRALLNRCQTEFERPPTIENAESITIEERLDAEKKLKARQLGNIKFIGELFKRRMLTEKIMHEVIKRLLLGYPPKEDHTPSEEELEVLCKLLKTVGQQLDLLPKAETYMNHYFDKLTKLREIHPTPRIGFMLQDVIDLRRENWVPRREETRAQTLSELEVSLVRKEIEKQQVYNQQASRHGGLQRQYSPHSPNLGSPLLPPNKAPRDQARGPMKTDEWTSVGIRKPAVTPKSPLISPSQQGFGQKGASMGRGMPMSVAPPKSEDIRVDNKFAALTPSKAKKDKKLKSPKTPTIQGFTARDEKQQGKEIDEETLENKANCLIEEFKNSTESHDLLDNILQVGHNNYKGLINKAIQCVVSSYAKHAEKRKLLATLLDRLTNEDDDGDGTPAMHVDYVYEGFQQFCKDVEELGMVEDNPKIWDSFADLLVHCLLGDTFSWDEINYLIPKELIFSDEIWNMVHSLFKRLKCEPNAVALCCSGHFDIMQKLFDTSKTTDRVDKLLDLLKEADCIGVDLSIFVYNAFKDGMSIDELLQSLKEQIPEDLSCTEVITRKIAAPTILYSAVASGLFLDQEVQKDPRDLFQKFLDLFNNQLIQPILKYTQNVNPKEKLRNELMCLLEAQRFWYHTGFQSGVLCNYFQVFYELEIVTEDTYYMWRDDDEDTQWVKSDALKEVQSFISFLENGEEGGEDGMDGSDEEGA
uniref:Eukaryotic translation initiation factor 4 gamma 2 n=1 Tax=Eutreptiella gymnastica TaxID=73025 RepID=A0A7S1NLV2_9EUGL